MKSRPRGDAVFEKWWNRLTPGIRRSVFQQIPLRHDEQVKLFSDRRWHELHGWMRERPERYLQADK